MHTGYELSPTAVAARLGVTAGTVVRWAKAGKLPHLRTPGGWFRFRPADVEAFVEAHSFGGGEAA